MILQINRDYFVTLAIVHQAVLHYKVVRPISGIQMLQTLPRASWVSLRQMSSISSNVHGQSFYPDVLLVHALMRLPLLLLLRGF